MEGISQSHPFNETTSLEILDAYASVYVGPAHAVSVASTSMLLPSGNVRRDREYQIRIIGFPRFDLNVQNRAAALALNDATGRLDIRQDFSMICVVGIFRLDCEVRERGIVRPRLYFPHEVLRIECCLHRNPGEVAGERERDDRGAVLSRDFRLVAGGQRGFDKSVGKYPELEQPILQRGRGRRCCTLPAD